MLTVTVRPRPAVAGGWHAGPVATRARPRSPAARAGAGASAWYDAVPAPVVLVTGTEQLLADRAVAQVRAAARAAHPDLEVVAVDAALYEAGQLATWTSPSLFGEVRLVEVTGLEAASDAAVTDLRAHLEAVGASPDEDVLLLVRHAGGQRARAVLDAARAVPGALWVDCPPVKGARDQRAFLQAELARARRTATPEALDALQTALGADVRELAAAVSQLVQDVPGAGRRGTIDVADVQRYYGGRSEVTGFAVADAAVAGRRAQALSLTRQAIEAGVDPVPIVAALAAKVRAMVTVAAGGRAGAGMAPWQAERARADLRWWTPEGIAAAIIALAEADEAVKGGSRDAVYAVERAVVVVTGARG